MAAMPAYAGDTMASWPMAQVEPGYRLGAEDIMLVSVWKDEQLTREVVVRPDGMFSFPSSAISRPKIEQSMTFVATS